MLRRYLVIGTAILLISGSVGLTYLFEPTRANSLSIDSRYEGIVEKRVGEPFTVKVVFKNRGPGEGAWRVSAAFESNEWTWKGEEHQVILQPEERETLCWEGAVPNHAVVDSFGRLIVYYDNNYVRQNWWIYVTSNPELTILHSEVW